ATPGIQPIHIARLFAVFKYSSCINNYLLFFLTKTACADFFKFPLEPKSHGFGRFPFTEGKRTADPKALLPGAFAPCIKSAGSVLEYRYFYLYSGTFVFITNSLLFQLPVPSL
ncbi:MAG: hypothetical protein IJF79_05210, partial [Clostridia bacterium]|nr:hypothetical protein [Clostridia bacterium]